MFNTNFTVKVDVTRGNEVVTKTKYVMGEGGGGPGGLPKSGEILPLAYELGQPFPNPFNPTVAVAFAVPEPSRISLNVYDLNGRLITKLIDGSIDAGFHTHRWDASAADGGILPSGVYIARVVAVGNESGERFNLTRKMIYLK